MPNDLGSAEALLEIALQFGTTLDLDKLLALVLEKLTKLLQAERALFALCDEQGRIQRAVVHNMDWSGPGSLLPISQGVINEVFRERKVVVVPDAMNHPEFHSHKSVELHGLRFMIGEPVYIQGKIAGVLYVDSRLDVLHDLNLKVQLATSLSRLVATALENTRLFEEQRRRNELLASLVHDFRAPLSVITLNCEALKGPPDQKALVDDIAASAQRMLRMMEDTIELTQSSSGRIVRVPVRLPLAEILKKHIDGFRPVARVENLELVINVDPSVTSVHTIPDRFWIVLDNLIFNAIKYGKSGTRIDITASLRADAGPAERLEAEDVQEGWLFRRVAPLLPVHGSGFVQISVGNHGPAIPPEMHGKLFCDVGPGSEARGHRSTGLGLPIVAQCVKNLGGRVWLDRSDTELTRFCFTLPTEVTVV